MFVCDGLQHGRICRREEKRTEKSLIVRSGISEAETTTGNNKRLRSTFCIEAIQTRSIMRALCNSRTSCCFYFFEVPSHMAAMWLSCTLAQQPDTYVYTFAL